MALPLVSCPMQVDGNVISLPHWQVLVSVIFVFWLMRMPKNCNRTAFGDCLDFRWCDWEFN